MSNWKVWYTDSESRRACGNIDPREWRVLLEAGEVPPPTSIGGARLWHVCQLADFIRKNPERLRPDQRPPQHDKPAPEAAA